MTDDEREALASFVTNRLADNGYAVPRPEVWLALSNWEALNAPLRRSEEPIAEHECSWACGVDRYGQDYHSEPQGEPSDTQVDAAQLALAHSGHSVYSKEGMRAALRAAGGVQ
ncbi:hypothetical protein SEA_JEHOSHAPHAT_13 [Microbacterium phage Jehoshaphat]|nr:hypothetical protein SEA_TEEHEE_13 [Microbacterium phage Teehee]QXN73406.1 hypothetical protein SEA_JEHOSHAPHAT_13 [Microbacterium phage Jehoshaphat]